MGWDKAKSAAWQAFGRRYWKLIVGLDIARRTMPAVLVGLGLAGLVAGVWWLYGRLGRISTGGLRWPEVSLPWLTGWAWALLAAVAVALGGCLIIWLRQPYRIPAAYRPGTWPRRIAAALALAGLTAVALVAGDR